MIDKDNSLRCDGCGKKLGLRVEGKVEIYCPRCKRFNVFESKSYQCHKLFALRKQSVVY